MNKKNKPIIVISKCLGFEACRYNGQNLPQPFVEKLKNHVSFLPICPEVEIGLGIPRDPIRIIGNNEKRYLYQPATELDITDKMNIFIRNFISELGRVDGFILKNRSPSCGIGDVKIYESKKKDAKSIRGNGFFGNKVLQKYTDCAVEDEGRLNNNLIREHYLIKLYTMSKFRQLSHELNQLIQFHSVNKLLFMAYNQSVMRKIGKILANHDNNNLTSVFLNYKEGLILMLRKPAKTSAYINILQHALGGFKNQLEKLEKAFFLNLLEEYRDERIPLSVPVAVLKSWAIKYQNNYILNQTFTEPFPKELINIEAYKNRRDYNFI